MALPLFSATLFLSAFTLFLVQPMIGKLILPMLGGTPQVWNTCMVFFQSALLTGYAYTHTATTRFKLHRQLMTHGVLLLLPLLFLFLPMKYVPSGSDLIAQQEKNIADLSSAAADLQVLAESESSLTQLCKDFQKRNADVDLAEAIPHLQTAADALRKGEKDRALSEQQTALTDLKQSLSRYVGPFNFWAWGSTIPLGGNPILWALGLLTLLVGVPFVVVSTSSPLLQRWFVYTGHESAKDPYFLSIASNVGSLLALLAYPVLIEPNLTLNEQKWTWTVVYILLGGLIMVCAATVWKAPPLKEAAPEPAPEPGIPAPAPTPAPAPPPPAPKQTQQTGISRKKFGKGHHAGKQSAAVTAHPPAISPAAAAAKAAELDIQLRSRPITPWRRLRWVLLAAAPSSLMLGVVTYICTDLSPIPLLWIIPLALYLLSFILVFARWPTVWTQTPHKVTLFLQPVLILGLIAMLQTSFVSSANFLWLFTISGPVLHISLAMLAFFATALVCHGEMAKDRPDTKHLTEFYLWMSVGGMVGGMFNGLVAPLLFWGVAEFPLAIMLGCLLRPVVKTTGWSETFIENYFPNLAAWFRAKGNELAVAYKRPEPNSTYAMNYTLDVVLPVLLAALAFVLIQVSSGANLPRLFLKFFQNMRWDRATATSAALNLNYLIIMIVPLAACFFFYNRPIRLGLGVGLLLLIQVVLQQMREESSSSKMIYADRTYFGVLRVREQEDELGVYRSLMHGSTHHGLNYQNDKYRRLATTYYHQYGPAGMVMKKFNWFNDGFQHPDDPSKWKGDLTTYTSDARICASLVGAAALGITFPVDGVASAWSEPPYATIGLGTGTMAAYGRPFQHVHYYEIDRQIRRLSLPENRSQMYQDGPYFTYLHDADKRGALIEVRMGDARLRMAYPYGPYNLKEENLGLSKGGGPQSFYHMMVVDAFSSDAIPIHLITLEAIKMYMDKLVPDGILCVHTSNRHVDLVPVVERVVQAIRGEEFTRYPKLACKRAHDDAPFSERGRKRRAMDTLPDSPGQFTSEWVMVARSMDILNQLKMPPLYQEAIIQNLTDELKEEDPRVSQEVIDKWVARYRKAGRLDYWTDPREYTNEKYPNLRAWTDDYSNVFSVFRW